MFQERHGLSTQPCFSKPVGKCLRCLLIRRQRPKSHLLGVHTQETWWMVFTQTSWRKGLVGKQIILLSIGLLLFPIWIIAKQKTHFNVQLRKGCHIKKRTQCQLLYQESTLNNKVPMKMLTIQQKKKKGEIDRGAVCLKVHVFQSNQMRNILIHRNLFKP